MTNVTIGNSVQSIGGNAFSECTSLTNIVIPDSVISIGNVFEDCSNLTSVTFGNGIESINDSFFDGCNNLRSVTIGSGINSISQNSLNKNSFTQFIVDSDNVTYSSLDGILFNKDQTVLIKCPQAQAGSYIIPDSVTSIVGLEGGPAFVFCDELTSVTLGMNVNSFGVYEFGACDNLSQFIVKEDNNTYSSFEGDLYNKDQSLLIRCPNAFEGNYTIKADVTGIGKGAFYDCDKLTSVTIPESVTKIGMYAFDDCFNLNTITIGSNVDISEGGSTNNFRLVYLNEGAGTYNRIGGSWTKLD